METNYVLFILRCVSVNINAARSQGIFRHQHIHQPQESGPPNGHQERPNPFQNFLQASPSARRALERFQLTRGLVRLSANDKTREFPLITSFPFVRSGNVREKAHTHTQWKKWRKTPTRRRRNVRYDPRKTECSRTDNKACGIQSELAMKRIVKKYLMFSLENNASASNTSEIRARRTQCCRGTDLQNYMRTKICLYAADGVQLHSYATHSIDDHCLPCSDARPRLSNT